MTDEESINAQLATQIMGWELLTIGYFGGEDETPRQVELEDWIEEHHIDSVGDYWIVAGTHFWINAKYWNPTLNIAQAFQMLEKFTWPDYHKAVFTRRYAWCCDIQKSGGKLFAESAETAPIAICLACLKTLEKE